ncbi:lipocalin family protein [Persicitalea jodogahamensis]|uniref:Lipocalin-like domain-containing protein n=1 Tax=Persicitalea jodogahamensis TaxID=402147 RepID=A0A8J3D1I3_9BACT|nr:lipocalin family protein [Persicitalea jodogahamensis]GHB53685.1 hypothetical protein GCM10007390_03160 [Persicitalea jodogahamensis]
MKIFRSTAPYSVAKYLAVVTFVLTSLISCKKDSDPSPGGKDGVSGNWQISAMTVTPPIDGISDYLAFLNALLGSDCLTKITFIFKADGTMDGNVPQACQANDPTESVGLDEKSTWKVQDKKIVITNGSDVSAYDLEVNETTMEWSIAELDPDDGKTYTTTIVFKRV